MIMEALVVYESMFGNTRQIAEAIAAGLAETVDVAAVEVSAATAEAAEGADLLVAGGPTLAFSMSRPSTRSDAISRGAAEGQAGVGLREWMHALSARHELMLPTFDTRVAGMRHWPGSAAGAAAKVGRHDGTSSLHRRCRSTSTMSTGRCSTVSSTGPWPEAGSWPRHAVAGFVHPEQRSGDAIGGCPQPGGGVRAWAGTLRWGNRPGRRDGSHCAGQRSGSVPMNMAAALGGPLPGSTN